MHAPAQLVLNPLALERQCQQGRLMTPAKASMHVVCCDRQRASHQRGLYVKIFSAKRGARPDEIRAGQSSCFCEQDSVGRAVPSGSILGGLQFKITRHACFQIVTLYLG